jgi:hypothetical protein
MKCPNCDNGFLFHYSEKQFAVISQLNKDNTISKRKVNEQEVSCSLPEFLECKDCKTTFDFELDDKERIVVVYERSYTGLT